MSQYTLKRYQDLSDYLEARKEYLATQAELDMLREQGHVVFDQGEIPLPPDGYPDDFIIVAKAQNLGA